ncbi:MAG TPA: efflux RND transporter periplasmic adaptor subunit [Acetobacteraceae bacterium]|nr:efflux RND transporter periplasmic adaptor subunit [Acetobacteraceae bacterium]
MAEPASLHVDLASPCGRTDQGSEHASVRNMRRANPALPASIAVMDASVALINRASVILLAGLILAGLPGWGSSRAAPPPSQAAVPVAAVPVTLQDVPAFLRGLGTVRAFTTVVIKAQVSGTLLAIPAREGQEVRQGDIIAQIDPRPYQAALDQARAQRAQDAAQLHGARLDLRRYQDLAARDFAPRQQVDDQQATVEKLAASLQADEAAIETATINLGFCTIRAPIGGRIGLYQTDPGNLIEVATQAGIVSIAQYKPIAVVFTLAEDQLPRLRQAMTHATVPVLAYGNDDRTRLAEGVLTAPDNTIDTTTGTISLKATFPNADGALWPGAFVNARVLVETLHQVLAVPFGAIQHGPDGLFAYVVTPDGTVAQRAIEIGYSDDAVAVVTAGLRAGESVVVSGQSRLVPGMRVSIAPASTAARSAGGNG